MHPKRKCEPNLAPLPHDRLFCWLLLVFSGELNAQILDVLTEFILGFRVLEAVFNVSFNPAKLVADVLTVTLVFVGKDPLRLV